MDAAKKIIVSTYKNFMGDSLKRNSSLLIFSQTINAVGAFIFWIICAHLFSAYTIGLATSFVAFGALVATFTNLGLPNTIIRFLPTSKNQGGMFAASFYLVFFFSVLGSFISILLIKDLAHGLGFVQSSRTLSLILILLITGSALSTLLDGTLMAFRKGEYILGKAIIVNVPRLILPFLIVSLGLRGLTGIYAVVLLVGVTYNLIIVTKKLLVSASFQPKLGEIKRHKSFVSSNYFGNMFGVLPSTLVPIIILAKLGAESAAYFYMPMQIAVFLGIISSSTSQALISETSQTSNADLHKVYFRKAFKHLYLILIPIVLSISVFGWLILRVYGTSYAREGYVPLLLLSIASLFVGINWLGDTWLNIKKKSKEFFLMNVYNALVIVCSVYIFASHGLVAASFGWLCGQIISAALYLIIFGRSQLIEFNKFTVYKLFKY